MPGSCRSHARASDIGISPKNDKSSEPPFSSSIRFSTVLIRGAFTFANPPPAIANSISSTPAPATASSVPNRAIKLRKARSELRSAVC